MTVLSPATNWAGNEHWAPTEVATPASVADLAATVREARERGLRIKPIGAAHSFTPIAATDGVQLSLDALGGVVRGDAETGLVTLRGGTRLRDIPRLLAPYGLNMTNLGDIDAQSIAGAISTGTHGTGGRFGGLSTQVRGLTLVLADGSIVDCDAERDPDLFEAARLGLGAIGVIAAVTLQCEPAFLLHAVERPVPLDEMLATVHERVDEHDHVEFFWFPHTSGTLYKQNDRLPGDALRKPLSRGRAWWDDEFLSNTVFAWACELGRAAPAAIRPIAAVSARALGAREYIDRSATVLCTQRRVRFRESEWSIPRAALGEALTEIRRLIERRGWRISFPVEVRMSAADDLWLSTAHGRDSAYVAVHQYHRTPHEEYFRAVQEIMLPLEGRPHWGKLHYLDAAELSGRYPRFQDFLAVRDRVDPDRAFSNAHLRQVLGA
ncbi:D-arabinono-1,4-lactone oxidase [Cryptosporangium arvum]|uniref:FAD-linked oxidoreductase n=1 Tax=Cryptosporangium arvum DSM 44712 TaxID=927661 RepID=A0A010YXH1_9ACTN|nr:D-arabinono-1,4-lactone oxidase [Cryptosporangium arvum]EXG79878.1 FAD-linked oxidoreductase [Cryptosporangium arvum DSM 44712]